MSKTMTLFILIVTASFIPNPAGCSDILVCSGLVNGYWQILIGNPKDGEFQQITYSEWDKYHPVWVGKLIAFEGRQGIWLMDPSIPDSHQKLDLPSGAAEPRWHGGRTIGFTLYRNTVTDNSAVYTYDIESGQSRKLFDKPYLDRQLDGIEGTWTWVSGVEMQGMEIWVCIDLAEGAWQITANGENDFCPRLSPDGKWVAFQSFEDRDSRIIVRPILGDCKIVIDQKGSMEAIPCWSADGSSVYFTSDRNKHLQIFRYDLENKTTIPVTHSKEHFTDPDCMWKSR